MIEGEIRCEQQFRHIETGTAYTVLFGSHEADGRPLQTLSKQGTGEWLASIVYADVNRPDMTFTRDEAFFRQNFERIDDDDFALGKACDLSGEGDCEACQ